MFKRYLKRRQLIVKACSKSTSVMTGNSSALIVWSSNLLLPELKTTWSPFFEKERGLVSGSVARISVSFLAEMVVDISEFSSPMSATVKIWRSRSFATNVTCFPFWTNRMFERTGKGCFLCTTPLTAWIGLKIFSFLELMNTEVPAVLSMSSFAEAGPFSNLVSSIIDLR